MLTFFDASQMNMVPENIIQPTCECTEPTEPGMFVDSKERHINFVFVIFIIISATVFSLYSSVSLDIGHPNNSDRNSNSNKKHVESEMSADCHSFDEMLARISIIGSMTDIEDDKHERYIRNLYITDTYKELSIYFDEFLFEGNEYFNDNDDKLSNWMSVAVWASNMVGQHIRKYSLYYFLDSILPLGILKPFYLYISNKMNDLMPNQVEITSIALSDGNIMVFNDIAYYSALLGKEFCDLRENAQNMNKSVIYDKLDEFKLYFAKCEYPLFDAYKHYIYVKYSDIFGLNKDDITEYMYYANLMIGFYEQQKLQKPLDSAVSHWYLPYFNYEITQYLAQFITRHVFELCVGDKCHWIGKNIKMDNNRKNINDFLLNIDYIPLKQVLMKWYSDNDGINIDIDGIMNKNAAQNWLNLNDRMKYVTALFLYHMNDISSHHDIFTNKEKQMIWNEYEIPPELV